jgi:hypothetical protein
MSLNGLLFLWTALHVSGTYVLYAHRQEPRDYT